MIGFNYRLTEVQAAIAIEQLKKLDFLNTQRLEMVNYLNDKLKEFDFLEVIDGRPDCISTYYQYPLLYKEEVTDIPIEEFRQAICEEGCYFFRGYLPLYFQPIYQTKIAFKHGQPFTAKENKDIKTNYYRGACPIAECLHDHEMLCNEHIRPPNSLKDMQDIVTIFEKMAGTNK
jgi:dTDP-4-amino-4,6-dideoxygalactose transaminase